MRHAGEVATPRTLYERVGGDDFFETLTATFYGSLITDPVLAALYPSDPEELKEARVNLRDFLIQFFGGPSTYAARRGPPRLRMRHHPFAIGRTERDAWVRHMAMSVKASGVNGLDEMQLMSYFEAAATATINRPESPNQGPV